MKQILTHKSRNLSEIVAILLSKGTFAFPNLPHYRYADTQEACHALLKMKLAKRTGTDGTSINIVPTNRLREWQLERDESITDLQPVRWVREKFGISRSGRKLVQAQPDQPA